MSDSSRIPFPGPGFDPTDPRSVETFIAALPPSPPNLLPIAAFPVKCGAASIYFRVTRAALERIAGDATLSTPMIAQRFSDEIETQCLALIARVDVEPVDGWTLDASDLIY